MKGADFVDDVHCTITSQCKNVRVQYFPYISDLFVVSTLQFCKQSTNVDKYCGLKHSNKSFTLHNLLVCCSYHPTWSKQETENEVDVAKLCNLHRKLSKCNWVKLAHYVHESYIKIWRLCFSAHPGPIPSYWHSVLALVIYKHWDITESEQHMRIMMTMFTVFPMFWITITWALCQ